MPHRTISALLHVTVATLLFMTLMPEGASAKSSRKSVSYELNGTKFEGVLIAPAGKKSGNAGLLLVPNWLGINEANLEQAEEISAMGFVVFVADLYGKEARPTSMDEAKKASGAVKADRTLMRARMKASYDAFLKSAKGRIDPKKVGAIGFCFGGTAVIELAKSGAALPGVVSFHGSLDAKAPWDGKPKASVLALHGAEDPAVPPADLAAFKDDLRKAGADWTLVEFGGAVHSFTDKHANNPGRSMYDAKVAARAYEMMRDFFAERFGTTKARTR